MRKLTAALPEAQRPAAERARERVLVLPDGWLSEADPTPVLPTLMQAVLADRRLRLRYARPGATPRWRTVDPLGLVQAAGVWYLLAAVRGASRTYRVSRIHDAEALDEPATTRPDGVDLATLWKQGRAAFRGEAAGLAVRVQVEPSHRQGLVAAALEVTAQDGDALDVVFGDARHAEAVLWRLAPYAVVVTPGDLAERLADRARRTALAYRPAR